MHDEATAERLPDTPKRTPAWKIGAHVLLFVGLVAIFAWQIKKNWAQIIHYNWQLNWELAALALLALLVCSLLDCLIWNRTLGWFTDPLPFRQLVPVYIWSYLARYIPGKVGSLVLRVALALEYGREAVPVLASSVVELALRTAAALLLLLVSLSGWGAAVATAKMPSLMKYSVLLIPLVLVCAHPKVMLPAMNWGLRKIKKPQITRQLHYFEVLGVMVAECLRWVLYGVAFFLLACAVFPAASDHALALIGAAAGSWAGGFIGVSPGGLGVSEAVLVFCLTSLHFPAAIGLALPFLARLWTLIGEALWALAAWILRKRPVVA